MPAGESGYAITHLMYQQELGGGYVGMAGRYNLLDLWTGFYPDYGRGVDGFMNVSMLIPFNVVSAGFTPVSNLVGIVKAGERGLEAGFMVTETQNSPSTLGMDFPNGVTLFGFARKFTDFADLPGSHLVLATYATGDFTNLDSHDWIQNPPGLPTPTTNAGKWSAG